MTNTFDWDPRDESVQDDQVRAYDEMRERCPVARSDYFGWSLLTYDDVVGALADERTFSNRVSTHVAVPNGMDPPEHTHYRAIVDRCFAAELVAAFEPELRRIASALMPAGVACEVMADIAEPFAAQAQCGYLDWPPEAAKALQVWSADSARATLARDRAELARVAQAFDRIIGEQIQRQRDQGAGPVMRYLLADESLTDATIVSIVRNWTAGELGTIAASVGIVLEFGGRHPDVQQQLRERPELRRVAIDEMLRLRAPLIANRRRTTREVSVAGRTIPPDEPVTILWSAAQRDPGRWVKPEQFRLDRDPRDNLLYGRGIHYCPGEGLARLELEVFLDEFLAAVGQFATVSATAARYPSGGFREVRLMTTTA